MSTILKSLQKLEKEKEAAHYASQSSGYSGPGTSEMHGHRQNRIKGVWVKLTLAAFIITALSVSGIYFFLHTSERPDSQVAQSGRSEQRIKSVADQTIPHAQEAQTSPTVIDQPSGGDQDGVTRPIQIPVSKENGAPSNGIARSSPGKNNQPLTTLKSQSESAVLEENPAKMVPAAKQAETGSQTGIEQGKNQVDGERGKAQAVAPKKSADNFTASNDVSKVSRPYQAQKTPSDPYADIQLLSDGRLKVNAIVWSTVQEDRMAVVNSRILHEGDTVDGFSLVAIRSDDVVVREDGKGIWRVLFGRP